MTGERMTRALKRGGCAIRRSDSGWDIKRTQDARSTTIGQLEAERVANLCREGRLKRLGDFDPVRLVWAESYDCQPMPRSCPTQALVLENVPRPYGSLVDRCLKALPCEKTRGRLLSAVTTYREDIMWATQAGAISGMNWRGLALGVRVDSSGMPDRPLSNRYASQAGWRLQKVAERFGMDQLKELNSLVVDEVSRNRFSEAFNVSRRKVEARAQAHLSHLADLYERDLISPSRI